MKIFRTKSIVPDVVNDYYTVIDDNDEVFFCSNLDFTNRIPSVNTKRDILFCVRRGNMTPINKEAFDFVEHENKIRNAHIALFSILLGCAILSILNGWWS